MAAVATRTPKPNNWTDFEICSILLGSCQAMLEKRRKVKRKHGWYSSMHTSIHFSLLKAISFIYLFIYLWLCWVFVSVLGLSLVAASGGHSSSRCVGLSLSRPLLLRSTGSRHAGSVIVAHGPGRSAACGIFPDQGSNPCALHWQADSQPLRHQGSPKLFLFFRIYSSPIPQKSTGF